MLTKPFAHYPHIRRAGELFFLAGQGCRDPETGLCPGLEFDADNNIVGYDIEIQTRGVFANIERALGTQGLTARNLVDITVFLRTMDDFETMNGVWNEYFGSHQAPTRTTVAVRDLPGNNFVEMKAVASASI